MKEELRQLEWVWLHILDKATRTVYRMLMKSYDLVVKIRNNALLLLSHFLGFGSSIV